jgi:hypothetical protein
MGLFLVAAPVVGASPPPLGTPVDVKNSIAPVHQPDKFSVSSFFSQLKVKVSGLGSGSKLKSAPTPGNLTALPTLPGPLNPTRDMPTVNYPKSLTPLPAPIKAPSQMPKNSRYINNFNPLQPILPKK